MGRAEAAEFDQGAFCPSGHLNYGDLEFEQALVRFKPAGDQPRFRWIDVGMPKLPPNIINGAFFLYPSRADAEAGTHAGGTGFAVTVPSKKFPLEFKYAVTNRHVVFGPAGASVIRLTRNDGTPEVHELDPMDWSFHPCGSDIAVAPLMINMRDYAFKVLPIDGFVDRNFIKEQEVGPGEDVFMVGRFVDHDGVTVNNPAVRFGHISIMPTPMDQYHGAQIEAYCIDMHSRTGYSGSPVYVYRTIGGDLSIDSANKVLLTGGQFFMLLGIHFGQFPEIWELQRKQKENSRADDAALEREGEFIKGVSGMTCVAPAWRILEVLMLPKFVKQREAFEATYAELHGAQKTGPEPEAASAAMASEQPQDNPNHREDFTRLVGAASRKRPQVD